MTNTKALKKNKYTLASGSSKVSKLSQRVAIMDSYLQNGTNVHIKFGV